MTVKRIRVDKPRIARERPGTEDLPDDPRDPDVVRVKALARSRPSNPRSNRDRLVLSHIARNIGAGGWRGRSSSRRESLHEELARLVDPGEVKH
jgi:hypothetical protein